MSINISGALVEALVKLLQGAGLLQEPDAEVAFRKAVADLEKTKAQVWVDFVKATTPDPSRVYIWANSVIALVRPAISLLIVVGMLFAPSRILDLVRTFGEAGPSGWIVLFPLLWWFLGRDASKVLAMRYGGLIPVGSGAAAPRTDERFLPADGRLERRFEQDDVGSLWERLERLEEVDGQVESMEDIEYERDRP